MKRLSTLLFDLDGTLLPMDNDHFTRGYFQKLVPYMAKVLPQESFLAQMLKSTEHMVTNEDSDLTNEQAFKQHFLEGIGEVEEGFWPYIEAFYANEFGELIELCHPTPIARAICEAAMAKGYRLVLATNPLFPRVATQQRMAWAHLQDIPFERVTTYENSHFCKPNPKYYEEILQKLDLSPTECMMIGNDTFEDLIAGSLGMQTYLVTDCLKEGEKRLPFTHQGTLTDLLSFVRDELPQLNS